MKLEKIILQKFITLIIVSSITLSVVFNYMSYLSTKSTMKETMERTALAVDSQMDAVLEQVSMVSKILLSDPDTLSAITSLARDKTPRGKYAQRYYDPNYTTIRSKINSYFISETYYRVLFFNELGDVVHATNQNASSTNTEAVWKDVPGIENVAPGKLVMMPVHSDEWGSVRQKEVVSFIKRLVGSNMGFIEVEMTKEQFADRFENVYNEHNLVICSENGEVLYSTVKEDNPSWLLHFSDKEKKTDELYYENKKLISYHWCEKANAYIVLKQDNDKLTAIFMETLPYLLLLIIGFGTFSILYSHKVSKALVAPIHALRHAMQLTDFENMDVPRAELNKNQYYSEEIDNLYRSYEEMIDRLKHSKNQEKYMSMLQLQAQMDLLQAQVNPHFIYNVLNVISAKGFMANDESICDICSCLGKMLRYSTNTKEKLGTVQEETEYLQLYLNLLKYRYEHKLQYSIDIDGALLQAALPKIVLQQIVENSVSHGYADKTGVMNIEVNGRGTVSEWIIHIKDDGDGMSPEKKEDLYSQFEQMRRKLSTERELVEMEIGGMGLPNTYARLYLIYGERMKFLINSGKEGTDICIEVRGENE